MDYRDNENEIVVVFDPVAFILLHPHYHFRKKI